MKICQSNNLLKRQYSGNVIDELKKSDKWRIHLKMKVNFMPSKDNDDKQ